MSKIYNVYYIILYYIVYNVYCIRYTIQTNTQQEVSIPVFDEELYHKNNTMV